MKMFYNAPASTWNDALPLGNGFMGAMMFGGTVLERIQLNEDSVWSGNFRERVNPDARQTLDEVRGLRARGGLTIDIAWREGELTEAYVTADSDAIVNIDGRELALKAGVRTLVG